MRDSIIESFPDPNRNIKISKLKEECSQLRFEKIALENELQKLREEIGKKDEIIRGLSAQISNVNLTNQNVLRPPLMSHY
jgi:chromosome segregation ATPase